MTQIVAFLITNVSLRNREKKEETEKKNPEYLP